MTKPEDIYREKVREALGRIDACVRFMESFNAHSDLVLLESAALQARKALEAIAYAAIAPNKEQYKNLRAQTEVPGDFRKDYNAKKIFQLVSAINKDFYPIPLLEPKLVQKGFWHFEKRPNECLTKKEFESFYNRLGKFLHADNPWGADKGMDRLAKDLPSLCTRLKNLLSFHFISIRTPSFTGAWVINAPAHDQPIRVVIANARGEYDIR